VLCLDMLGGWDEGYNYLSRAGGVQVGFFFFLVRDGYYVWVVRLGIGCQLFI
jgi:hypothetical protein